MKSKKLVLILTFACLFLAGCFNPDEEKEKIRNSIQPFYETFLFEDIEGTMGYFTLNSESYYETYQSLLETFHNYKLLYDPVGISFDSVTKESVKVKVKVHITGVGPEKEKIDREVIHHLEYRFNSEGEWKIFSFEESSI